MGSKVRGMSKEYKYETLISKQCVWFESVNPVPEFSVGEVVVTIYSVANPRRKVLCSYG